MRKLIIIILLATVAASCHKDKLTNTVVAYVLHPIPNWAKDTLVATTPYAPYSDTIYSYTTSGRSFIIYHGATYEVWDKRPETAAWNDSDMVYSSALIGPYLSDSTGILPVKVNPRIYRDNTGQEKSQQQSITVPNHAPFTASAIDGLYQHRS